MRAALVFSTGGSETKPSSPTKSLTAPASAARFFGGLGSVAINKEGLKGFFAKRSATFVQNGAL